MADNLSDIISSLTGMYAVPVVTRVAATPTSQTTKDRFAKYVRDPIGYFKEVLKVTPTDQQNLILDALPGRVKINSGHSIGKSFVCAGILSWWYDTRNPGVIISTAPTARDITDILWTEVRLQRARAELDTPYIGPSAPVIFDHEEHQ